MTRHLRKLALVVLTGTMLMVPYGGGCDQGYGYGDFFYDGFGAGFGFGGDSYGYGYDDYYYEETYGYEEVIYDDYYYGFDPYFY